jgi:hypothetical protein
MTHAVRDFDQLWSRPKGRLPEFRLCRKCRLCHPKHIRGCPTEDLRTEIETLRLVLKNKNATMQVREKFLAEVDERVSEFLMCIEGVRPDWLAWAAGLLNTTAAELHRVWQNAKLEVENQMEEAERQAKANKDPNRKRITITPEDEDNVRT